MKPTDRLNLDRRRPAPRPPARRAIPIWVERMRRLNIATDRSGEAKVVPGLTKKKAW